MADHQEGLGYLLCVGPIALDILDATKYTPPVDSAIAPLKFELFKQEKLAATYCVELDQTKKALEQETVRLANCGVASIGAGDAPDPLNYDYSAAYESTYLLYKKYKQALRVIEDLKRGRGRYKSIAEKKEGKNVKNKSLSTRKSRRKS